jgi:hypothetical protein
VRPRRRPLPKRLALFVDLEACVLKVVHDPSAELFAGTVGDMLLQNVPEQVPAPADGKADRKDELVAEAAVVSISQQTPPLRARCWMVTPVCEIEFRPRGDMVATQRRSPNEIDVLSL